MKEERQRRRGTKQESKTTHDLELHDLAVELDGPDFLRVCGVFEREGGSGRSGVRSE